MTKIEELAREMFAADGQKWRSTPAGPRIDTTVHVRPVLWEELPGMHEMYRAHVRAVLTALREPSDAMVEAFMGELQNQHVAMDEFSDPIFPARLFTAMIDAVLNEGAGE